MDQLHNCGLGSRSGASLEMKHEPRPSVSRWKSSGLLGMLSIDHCSELFSFQVGKHFVLTTWGHSSGTCCSRLGLPHALLLQRALSINLAIIDAIKLKHEAPSFLPLQSQFCLSCRIHTITTKQGWLLLPAMVPLFCHHLSPGNSHVEVMTCNRKPRSLQLEVNFLVMLLVIESLSFFCKSLVGEQKQNVQHGDQTKQEKTNLFGGRCEYCVRACVRARSLRDCSGNFDGFHKSDFHPGKLSPFLPQAVFQVWDSPVLFQVLFGEVKSRSEKSIGG